MKRRAESSDCKIDSTGETIFNQVKFDLTKAMKTDRQRAGTRRRFNAAWFALIVIAATFSRDAEVYRRSSGE